MLQFNFTPFPVLNTNRLILRKLLPADADDILAMRSIPEVMQYIGRPLMQTQQEALELIEKITNGIDQNEGINWGMELKTQPGIIGIISFWRTEPHNHRAEVGYMLHPDFHRQGFTQEALKAMLDYGFNTMQLHSAEARTDPRNMASRSLLEKNGFVQEGWLKDNYFFEGTYSDTVIYSLLTPIR